MSSVSTPSLITHSFTHVYYIPHAATIQSLAQTYNSIEYNDDMLINAVEITAPNNSDLCDEDPSTMVLYCSYKNQSNYIVFLTLWIVYFVIAILNKLSFTYQFNTADLRFYIAGERCCAATFTKVLTTFYFAFTHSATYILTCLDMVLCWCTIFFYHNDMYMV